MNGDLGPGFLVGVDVAMNASLIVVAKKPEPGFTKTRLCPPFTPIEAAQFYRCLMLDTLALAARVQNVEHCLAYAPLEANSYFQDLVPEGFSLIPQHGANLGERLANTLADRFQNGYRKAVVMNSDGPTLPLPYLNQAFRQLQHYDVSLGMGHDGGYYLIGMKRMQPQLFENISWSSDRVISQTLDACRRLQLKVHRLPQWYDVDVSDDLQRLRSDLARNPTTAPHTAAYLQRWDAN
jgi:rSAM/selenodomain-associated transferase 1